MVSWLYYLGHWSVRLFLFIFTRFEIKGRNNIPKTGAILVASNHLSLMDPPVVGVSLGRITIFMAKEELFRSRFSGYFISRFGAFPVHRGRIDREAIRQAEKVLSRGQALVMFPEGHRRGQEGYIPEGFLGAALIAARADVPILPIGLTGTEGIKGWKWMLKRPRIAVNIGVSFRLNTDRGLSGHDRLKQDTQNIMIHIAELLPESYRSDTGDSL
jgi:1-acyl-sn-glycerol-3-phosphate acyltransferase